MGVLTSPGTVSMKAVALHTTNHRGDCTAYTAAHCSSEWPEVRANKIPWARTFDILISQNTITSFQSQSLKNGDTTPSLQAISKQAVGWIWPTG